MQKQHVYPSKRMPGPPILWRARPDASIDAEPLPKQRHVIQRVRRIREVFLTEFAGCSDLQTIGNRCVDLGLLNGLASHTSCYMALTTALAPICEPRHGYRVTPGLERREADVRPR